MELDVDNYRLTLNFKTPIDVDEEQDTATVFFWFYSQRASSSCCDDL